MRAIFQKLLRLFGWRGKKPKRVIGMGEFEGGPKDLATNKKHMEGFGR